MASTWPSITSMAKTSNSRVLRSLPIAISGILLAALLGPPAAACPFCTALAPTLSQLRDRAAITALAEVESQAADRATKLKLHKVLTGAERISKDRAADAPLEVKLDRAATAGTLLLIFGTGPADAEPAALEWHAVPVNEISYAYFARAPSLKTAADKRLRYFAGYLEHAEPLIAQDAYLEFGHAPFDEVARVADALSSERLRAWLFDDKVPPERKGFYGLAIGLVGDAEERRQNAQFVRTLIDYPDNDFRAGFDGLLGGYLLLKGTEGLNLIERRFLLEPHARDGDVRHAMTALRFYHEYGHDIPADAPERGNAAVDHSTGVRGRGDH